MKTTLSFCLAWRFRWVAVLFLLLSGPRGFSQFSPPSVIPPVRITSPANHATFYTPVDIPLFVFARFSVSSLTSPAGSSVTNVEFFAGTNDLGSGFNLGSASRPTYANLITASPIPRLGNIYCLTWSNPPTGTFTVTAVATAGGVSKTSAPVSISILASATNSNPADVVSIVATDPVAIAGTNAYVWRGLTNLVPSWTNWGRSTLQWFTNWGPKNATFTLRRFGDASSNLTVNYNVGGTASNGVDFVALPGYVTVPAGTAYAVIPIVPIDNGASNLSKTVTLTLAASTNLPPYVVGYPLSASALILENGGGASSALLPGGNFHLAANGPDGAWFAIQYSSDLVGWSSVCTNQVFQGAIDFIDPDASNVASRYYRAVPLNNMPSQ